MDPGGSFPMALQTSTAPPRPSEARRRAVVATFRQRGALFAHLGARQRLDLGIFAEPQIVVDASLLFLGLMSPGREHIRADAPLGLVCFAVEPVAFADIDVPSSWPQCGQPP